MGQPEEGKMPEKTSWEQFFDAHAPIYDPGRGSRVRRACHPAGITAIRPL